MGRWRDTAILVVILALGWAFWLHRIGVNDHDDALSNELLFAREPVATIVSHIPWGDQSPLYFLGLHVVRHVGESPFTIQVLNAILLTLTLISTYALGRAFASAPPALAAIFLGVLSPASLWLVRSGRMYSLQVLLSVVSMLCLVRYLDRRRARDLAVLTLLCVLNVYNHFVGFLITAMLFLPLLVGAAADAMRRIREGKAAEEVWRPLLPVILAGIGILLLTLPQILRIAPLVGGGLPHRPGRSLPGLSGAFLERVSWFWFVNAEWGSVRGAARLLTAIYLGSAAVLAVAGLAAARRQVAGISALWIMLPLLALGLAALRVDVRDRHLVWVLPVLWLTIASGAVGPLPSGWRTGVAGDLVRGVRAALFLAVAVGSLWLLWHKLPERYPQWTKLMQALRQIDRTSLTVYMPPGPATGTPRLLASQLHLSPALQDIRPLSGETRTRFLGEIDHAREFVLLAQGGSVNPELLWRARYLEARGYQKSVLAVWGAQAQIFTRDPIEGFSRADRITPDASPERVVGWARQHLSRPSEPRAAPSRTPVLADGLVASVQGDGTIHESRLFTSQRGESASWRLGANELDTVDEVQTSSGGVERSVMLAHPARDAVLVVAFPAVKMDSTLRLLGGIADSDRGSRPAASVSLAVYIDGTPRGGIVDLKPPGWQERVFDTAALRGRTSDIVLLLATTDPRTRDVAFTLAPSSRRAQAPPEVRRVPGGSVILTDGRTLKDSLERLQVSRIAGRQRLDAWFDPATHSASDMHERQGPDGEGTLQGRWALGPLLWDSVGRTRERSAGEVRDGLWAHPKEATTLVIEAPRAVMGPMLRGYFGVTDFSVERALERGVTAPVHVRILVDGRSVLEREAPRARGWNAFAVPIPDGPRERSVRIEIVSSRDSWAHFVFDLWAD